MMNWLMLGRPTHRQFVAGNILLAFASLSPLVARTLMRLFAPADMSAGFVTGGHPIADFAVMSLDGLLWLSLLIAVGFSVRSPRPHRLLQLWIPAQILIWAFASVTAFGARPSEIIPSGVVFVPGWRRPRQRGSTPAIDDLGVCDDARLAALQATGALTTAEFERLSAALSKSERKA